MPFFRVRLFRRFALVLASFALVGPAALRAQPAAPLPPGEMLAWGQEPVLAPTATRGEIVLNGLWRFLPARGPAEKTPAGQWGWIRVPGVWDRTGFPLNFMDGPLALGSGPAWDGLKLQTPNASFAGQTLPGVERAWYEREVTVPREWAGRAFVLDVARLSTDAKVLVNGKVAGELHWPGGELDLTPHLRPGEKATLTLLVVAAADARDVTTYMDADRPETRRASLDTRGLTGDVRLLSRPAGPRIDGLFIKPSVRRSALLLDLELAGPWSSGPHVLSAVAREWPSGAVSKEWKQSVSLDPAVPPRDLVLPWADAKRWDFEQPNLYTLEVALRPAAAPASAAPLDAVAERFGFREFRVEGRRFLLNEQPYNFRLRGFPFSSNAAPDEVIRRALSAFTGAGFNLGYDWPDPQATRGKADARVAFARLADEHGLPVAIALPEGDTFFDVLSAAPEPAAKAAWRAFLVREWRRLRNHPSVVIFLFQGNRFSHGDDQNPRRLGQSDNLPLNPSWQASREPARRLIAEIKALDSTRAVTSHHSTGVGDYHTSNNYLNMHPLQERRDWLSEWAARGDQPFSAVEFDPPFTGTLTRGRKGFGGATTTEPLLTEYLAIYQGPAAFLDEDAAYRASIAKNFRSAQAYEGVSLGSTPGFQKFTSFWVKETWQTWRQWGLSGGMWAWEDASGWARSANSEKNFSLAPWQPGQLGPWVPAVLNRQILFSPEGFDLRPAGEALRAAHAPTQAWIAGHLPEASGFGAGFTDETHHYASGARVKKQLALLNDHRAPTTYSATLRATLGGAEIWSREFSGKLPVGEPVFAPFAFDLPPVFVRTDGEIRLETKIGDATHTDTFPFRVYPERPAAPAAPLLVWDPEGDTTAMLRELGFTPTAWDGAAPAADSAAALVVGRRALSSGAKPPGSLEAFLAAGGRVVLGPQDAEWLRTMSPLRVNRHVARRLWPVPTQAAHPILEGLDGEDFRDWAGAGTLLPAEQNTELLKTENATPRFGWRWGNHGSVASLMLEKPHLSAWTPLLEGEFDLAYSPLLERRHGAGLLIFNGLDFEGRVAQEPAAALVATRLFAYAASTELAPLPAETRAVYVGGPAGARLLEDLGLAHVKAAALPALPVLAILGPDAAVSAPQLANFLHGGGRALVLARDAAGLERLGWRAAPAADFNGARELLAWPELRGLSLSDLRPRAPLRLVLLETAANRETAAAGALGRVKAGDGVAVFVQLDPSALGADDNTYLRLTRWRFTRALAQLAANLGARFERDADFFKFEPMRGGPLVLGGEGWRYEVEAMFPPVAKAGDFRDPGNEGLKKGWHKPDHDASAWSPVTLPVMMENLSGGYQNATWAIWFRREFEVSEEFVGQPLVLELGAIDDFDEVYLNGVRVGGRGMDKGSGWNDARSYPLRPGFVQSGKNVIAVRVFNNFGGGGFASQRAEQLALRLRTPPTRPGPYVPDWRDDHALGDDPARYYRW